MSPIRVNRALIAPVLLGILLSMTAQVSHAGCDPPCSPPFVCPLTYQDMAIHGEINPPGVPQRAPCCDNPRNPDGSPYDAEDWANHFGLTATGTDRDRIVWQYWEQKPPLCICYERLHDPQYPSDHVAVTWSGSVDLTNPGIYYLTAEFTNDQTSCKRFYDSPITVRKPVQVTSFADPEKPEPPELPMSTMTYTTTLDFFCDVFFTSNIFWTYFDWERIGPNVIGDCGEYQDYSMGISVATNTTHSVAPGGQFTLNLAIVKVAIGGTYQYSHTNHEETSLTFTPSCSAIPCHYAMPTFYQLRLTHEISGTLTFSPECAPLFTGQAPVAGEMEVWTSTFMEKCWYAQDETHLL
jgi:hypothetical protein